MADLGIHFRCGNPEPKEMLAVAGGLSSTEWTSTEPSGNFPPRQGVDVIQAVLEGREDEISILEWANLFTQSEWPETDEQSLDNVCFLLFRAVVKRKPVTNLLLFRAALFLNGGSYFSEVLLAKIHMLSGVVPKSHATAFTVVVNARDSNFSNLAVEAISRGVRPFQLFNSAGLSVCRALIKQTTHSAIRLASSPVLLKYSPWFTGILKHLSKPDQVALIEAIAIHGNKALASEARLVKALKSWCDPSAENSLWYELNTATLKVLMPLLKVSQYFKIRDISRQLEKSEALDLPDMSETTQKNIRSRILFWSNYQTRLLSVRVLLPHATAEFLNRSNALGFWYERMSADSETEVLVLEFDDVLTAEFLRGPSTDLRLFRKSNRNAHLLQQGNIRSPDDIRRMYQDDEHDHLLAWQWAAEKLLRVEYSIRVDEGVTWFKGLSEQAGAHTPRNGLPEPDTATLANRNHELESWWKRFLEYESKLGKYGKTDDEAGSQKVFADARHYGRTGQKKLRRISLEAEARKGETLALILLVKDLLLSGRGTHEERIRGEHWLSKLQEKANAGDEAAKEFLKK